MRAVPIEWLLDALLRGMLIAWLLAIAWLLRRDRAPSLKRQLWIALALGLCVQALTSSPIAEDRVAVARLAPFIGLSVGNAVLFWLFVRTLVDDAFVVRWGHLAIWGAVVVYAWVDFQFFVGTGAALAPALDRVRRWIAPLFAVLSAVAASRHWRDDLDDRRRRMRGFVVVAGIGYSVLALLARTPIGQGPLASLGSVFDVLFLLVIVGVIVAAVLRLSTSELPAPASAPASASLDPLAVYPAPAEPALPKVVAPPSPPDPAELRLAEALQRAMVVERAYRTEDLTVAGLAALLAVPEYRLRRLINQRLGHRNFNAYVNGYRLEEARTALADPARRDLPILTIALDAGFQSIGPFNRAFKAATGLTPGEFRREKLADS